MGRYEGPIAPELAASRHFWRGVVDGDGSIFILKTGYSGISLTVWPHKSIYELSTAGHLAELIIDELYRNPATALDRKAAAAAPIIESVRARRIRIANDVDELRRRREAGATLVELGRHYGVSNVTILYRVRKAGIPRRPPWPSPKNLPKSA